MSIGAVPYRRTLPLLVASFVLTLLPAATAGAQQQFFGTYSSRFELSEALEVPEADTETKARLEQAAAFSAAEQWDEAIEIYRQLMESDPTRVVAASPRRYVPVAEYCQLRLASLPAAALELYRGRVDAQARRAYEEAVSQHDTTTLRRIAEQFFASSIGDEALLALGDEALERGEFGTARGWWEKLVETPPSHVPRETFERATADATTTDAERARLAHWYAPDSANPPAAFQLRTDEALDDATRTALVNYWKAHHSTSPRLAYPGSDLDLAAIRARLVLVSILEGSLDRARGELDSFRTLHGDARGRLGGRDVNYAEALTTLLADARDWEPGTADTNWPTFAGSMTRNRVAPRTPRAEALQWGAAIKLPKAPATDSVYPSPRVAESKTEILSYYPLVVGRLLLVNTLNDIRAFDIRTGKAAFGDDPVIFHSDEPGDQRLPVAGNTLGVARFTMTEHNGLLLARMGDPHTARPEEVQAYREPSYLVCLDLAAEGRMAWPPLRAEAKWAFEGAPVADGERLYVALRHGTRPQLHVACYDLRTGRPVWKQFVASAETPARGQTGECTHTLLTLAEGMLYVNTHLGAVAALRCESGRPQWIVHYPRAKHGDLNQRATHYYRDLTPCVYDRGRVIAAPSDSEQIAAYDAATGLLLWETDLAADVVHLLGVAGEQLWATGDKLWRIDMLTGKASYPWPEGPSPRGFGRGVLAGTKVYFPTPEAIHIFDQLTGREEAPLDLQSRGLGAGNLIPAGDRLIIAGATHLVALGPTEDAYAPPLPLPPAERRGDDSKVQPKAKP